MATALFSNCRAKPFKTSPGYQAALGSPGTIRAASYSGGRDTPTIVMRATTLSEVLDGTSGCTASFNGSSVDTRSPGTLALSDYARLGASFTSGYLTAGQSMSGRGWGTSASVPVGSSVTYDFLVSSYDDGSGNYIYIEAYNLSGACAIDVYTNGVLRGTVTPTYPSYNGTVAVPSIADFALVSARVVVRETGGYGAATMTLGVQTSQVGYSTTYNYACQRVNSTTPFFWYAGCEVASWDASDYNGAKYRTLTAVSAGAGTSYLRLFPSQIYNGTFETLAASVGTHHAEIDELTITWID